jgi:hypothetical protein
LNEEGLYPIRVRLRDLSLDRHISEALPKALFPPDRDLASTSLGHTCDDPFLGGRIFNKEVTFHGATICQYVLILDGWDEISISATEGIKARVARMLEQIRAEFLQRRAEFLQRRGAPVRVIPSGRPSTAVIESLFLRESTPILTIRPIRPEQLRKFVGDLDRALRERAVEVKDSQPDQWTLPSLNEFEPMFKRYESDFKQIREGQMMARREKLDWGSLAMLGLPLLAHLAVRLIAQWVGDRFELLADRTTLYRSIVDLTCEKGGNIDELAIDSLSRITGTKLRKLLQGTAAAMTAYGGESIPYRELSLRLRLPDDELDQRASELVGRYDLTSLMISFFFKGGHTHLGCEFVHKSFREYLFAEAIVEALKDFGRDDSGELRKRASYYKEFNKEDPQYGLTRTLSELLSPQWLSPEVAVHVEQLLAWEIQREVSGENSMPKRAGALAPISLEQCQRVRDGLADVWLWWGEGVHMRPQLVENPKTRAITFEPPYAHELVEAHVPWDRSAKNLKISPPRVTTADANLGDALFRLCAIVHYRIAIRMGRLVAPEPDSPTPLSDELWSGISDFEQAPCQCQSKIVQPRGSWVLFAPPGDDPMYFQNYISRINSAGWYPFGFFPSCVYARGTDLRQAFLAFTDLRTADLSYANLSGADLSRADLSEADLSRAILNGANLREADLSEADLSGADLRGASLGGAVLSSANLTGARMT